MPKDVYAAMRDEPNANLKIVLNQLAGELELAAKNVAIKEAELEAAKEVHKQIAEERVPAAMDGMEGTFILENGKKLICKEELRSSIAGDKRVPAIAWLDDHDYGHIVKRELVIQFARDELKAFRKFQRDLMRRKKQLIIKEQFSVHHATLNAWVKEQLSEGVNIPRDIFGIFRQRTAKVKE